MRVDAANGGQVEARGDEGGGPRAIFNGPNARLVVGDVASCRAGKRKKKDKIRLTFFYPLFLLPIHMAANLVDHPVLGRRPLEHRQVAGVIKGN